MGSGLGKRTRTDTLKEVHLCHVSHPLGKPPGPLAGVCTSQGAPRHPPSAQGDVCTRAASASPSIHAPGRILLPRPAAPPPPFPSLIDQALASLPDARISGAERTASPPARRRPPAYPLADSLVGVAATRPVIPPLPPTTLLSLTPFPLRGRGGVAPLPWVSLACPAGKTRAAAAEAAAEAAAARGCSVSGGRGAPLGRRPSWRRPYHPTCSLSLVAPVVR